MTETTRKKVLKMIRERIGQAVILTHHLAQNDEPFEYYVREKSEYMPSLDSNNKAMLEKLAALLLQEYGVEIEYRIW